MTSIDLLPDDAESLKRRLLAREEELVAARASQAAAEAEAAHALAQVSSAEAMIAHYKLTIEKLKRALYGQRSERGERLLDQLELQLEELEATATEDALVAETVDATTVRSFTRKKTGRKPFPEHLPRERVVVPGPTACTCCGSDRLAKIGEDVTETLEVVPRKWKVIQTVREKFTCRACESIGQAPAPFHVIPRGWAGPNLLAMMLFDRRRCSSTRPIVAVSILSTICGASPGSSRPTPMPASTGSTMARVGRARSPKQHAGRMAVVSSSNWPTRRCAREAGYRLSRSRQ
jgi:transposase